MTPLPTMRICLLTARHISSPESSPRSVLECASPLSSLPAKSGIPQIDCCKESLQFRECERERSFGDPNLFENRRWATSPTGEVSKNRPNPEVAICGMPDFAGKDESPLALLRNESIVSPASWRKSARGLAHSKTFGRRDI